jgi:hypothetical protein
VKWKTEEREGVYEEKFIKIVLTAGCKLICSQFIFKDKHKQDIKSDRRKYEESFCKERGSEKEDE